MSIRIAFHGAGFIAGMHARALAKVPEVALVGVFSKPHATAEAFAAKHAGIEVFSDFREMLDQAKPDAVFIGIPPFAHTNEVEEAAARGIHVFIEKPIALEIEKAQRMVEVAEAAGIITQVGFQMRYHPAVEMLRERIASGEAGVPVLFTGRYWTHMDGSPWWRDRNCSGGQITEQVIHLYDLAAHLMGEGKLASATGYLANVTHQDREDYTIEDVSAGMIPLASGGVAMITGCNAVRPMHFIADFRAVFANAFLDYSSTGQAWVTPDTARLTAGENVLAEWSQPVDLWAAQDADFIAAIREKRPSRTPLKDGLRALEWVRSVVPNLSH